MAKGRKMLAGRVRFAAILAVTMTLVLPGANAYAGESSCSVSYGGNGAVVVNTNGETSADGATIGDNIANGGWNEILRFLGLNLEPPTSANADVCAIAISGTDPPGGTSGGGNSDTGSVTGSGHLVSRLIALPGVTSVVVETGFVVHLTMGEPEQATIRVDDNLTDLVDATVTDGQLRLGLKPGSKVRNATLSAEVTVRHLDQLSTSGASQVTGSVGVDHLEASLSGASTLALSGNVGSLRLSAAGTSQLLGPDLTVADLDAVLSGASQASVAVSDTLAATADGVSVLHYRGTPTIIRQQTSGISSIVRDSP